MHKNKSIILRIYNNRNIFQLRACIVQIEHKNKELTCKFFLVPGQRSTLLGNQYIKILDILSIQCNTINTNRKRREINI